MTDRDKLDRRLRESGERWRARHLPMPTIDEAMFRGRPAGGSASGMRWLSAVAGLAVIAVVAAVALRTVLVDPTRPGVGVASATAETSAAPASAPATASPLPQPTATPGSTAPPLPTQPRDLPAPFPAIVRDGSQVFAHGYLIETDPGVLLCQMMVWRAPQTPPKCAFEPLVPVTGVDVREIGAEFGGLWVTDYVRVDGMWNDGAFAAARVTPAERPRPSDQLDLLFPVKREVPCEAPPGGWPDPPDDEQSLQPLSAEVEGNPDKYVGLWSGEVTDAEGNAVDLVVVVGTVADVASVAAELRPIYPFNPCITRAEYSRRELQEVADRLSPTHPDWDVYVEPSLSRIVVRLVVFDSSAEEATRQYADKVLIRPVVERVD